MTRFKPTSREVWLTIDDGPDPIDTPKILDLLDRYQATATFFVKGLLAHAHPDLIREILRRGHSVANHSMTHPSATFWCLPPRRIAWEIDSCGDEIEAVSGIRPRWFRAPVGMKNPFVHPLLERREMALIGWTARGFDAVLHDPDRVVRLVRRNVRPGAIILIHEGHGSNNGQRPEILRKVLQWLQDEHYSFVLPGEEQFRY